MAPYTELSIVPDRRPSATAKSVGDKVSGRFGELPPASLRRLAKFRRRSKNGYFAVCVALHFSRILPCGSGILQGRAA